MMKLDFSFPGPILSGPGTVRELGRQVQKMGGKRPLLVTGKHIEESGLLERALISMGELDLSPIVFQDAHSNPTDKDVKKGAIRYREEGCDVIVAIGGGSRMDVAKGVRLLATHPGDLAQYFFDVDGFKRITPNMPPLICVPTTAGSGSEVSRGTVITDTSQNRKRLIAGPGMVPTMAILDPELSVSMPPELTAMTGIDALSHAVETYVGTNFNPIAQGLSRHAAAMIHTYFPKVMENGNDLEARSHMLLASSMAAIGFSKGLGAVHSLAHQVTPEADIPHGLAISILLPHGMEFNLSAAARGYADLAFAMGIVPRSIPDEEAGRVAINTVREFARQFGLPTTLSEAGLKWESIPRLANNAMLDHCHRTNPRPCTENDMRRLFEQAF